MHTEWSNGPTERRIDRLKLLMRAAYGRAKLDPLLHGVLHAVDTPGGILDAAAV